MVERKKTRRYPGAKGPRPDGYEQRVIDAQARMEAWQSLSPKQQLRELDRRLGKDVGAKKQRARLQRLIERANRPSPAPEPEPREEARPEKVKAKDRRRREKRRASK